MNVFSKGGIFSSVVGSVLLFGVMAFAIKDETPLGSLAGNVRMLENGLPLSNAAIIISPTDMNEDSVRPRVLYSDKEGEFRLGNMPAGHYTIEASAKVHKLKPTDIQIREGALTTVDLELEPGDPTFRLYTAQRVFMPEEKAQVEAHGFGPQSDVAVKVYKIDLSKFLAEGSIYGVLYSISNTVYRGEDEKRKDPSEVGTLVSQFNHRVQNADAEGTFMDVIDLKSLKDGFYWVQCKYGALESGAFLSISNIAVVTKSSPGNMLCFVTDLKSGKPVANVPVSMNDNGKWKQFGTTDGRGLASLTMAGKGQRMLALATMGDSQAVSAFYMNASQGAEEDEEEGSAQSNKNTTVFVYTDRPIYRPGDDVQFKGFARTRVGSQYNLPGPGKVKCEIRDIDGTLVDEMEVAMDANGAFHGHYQSNPEAAPGPYEFTFNALGQVRNHYVTLAAYRKPEFSIKVNWSKGHYTMGEKIKATIKCEYYFGGPVAGAKVSASMYRNQDWSSEWDSDEYGEPSEADYGGYGGDYIDTQDLVTDENGEAVYEFEPKAEKLPDDYYYTPNYIYTLDAAVTDAGDKYFSGSGSVPVSQGAINLRVDPDHYIVNPGKSINVTLSTTKVEDDSPAANQRVRVMYGTELWSRRTDSVGWQSVFTAQGELSATTNGDGKAVVSIPAGSDGSLVIKASTTDDMRNEIKQSAYVYVGTDNFSPPPTAPDLSITLDKKIYDPGDICKVLITTTKPGATALVTVEAEKVMKSEVVAIKDQSAVVEIPVDKGYLPRVTISVVAVQNKKFLETKTSLKVDVTARQLAIEITSDRAQYLPGSTATYTVKAVGPDGKPTSTDLSLGVVDEGIYAVREDNTNPLKEFYPARPNLVSTNYSFPELYLDGGDKGGEIPIRMNFKDTAAWFPSIKTDANGSATVQVKLPDNLTKWRATAVGISDATDVGMATQFVVVNKPLMVRLQGPRFMVNGDHQEVAAIVTNNSGSDATVRVSLEATGFSTEDAMQQSLRIGNGKSESARWNLAAGLSGQGRLVAKAWIEGGVNDGVEQKIEIQPHARQVDTLMSGDIHGTEKFRIARRPAVDPTVGRLKISVSPTIGTSVYDSLDQLINYPYGCVEQTMSRFLPAMVVSGSLKQVGVMRPDLQKRIPTIASQSIAKLKAMQHSDGGWGWWEYDSSDPFMTAYVLDGLKQAEDAGYDINPFMTDQGLSWASKAVTSADASNWKSRDRLYVIYVLALYGKKEAATKAFQAENLAGQGAAQLATAAMAANLLGTNFVDERDRLIEQVRQLAVVDGPRAYWNPRSQDSSYWWDSDGVYGAELSAIPVLALQAILPNDPLIARGVRGLIMTRQGDWWWSTRDSSFAVMAIAKYMKTEEMPSESSRVTVLINGQEAGKLDMSLKNLRGMSPTLTVPVSRLRNGESEIELRVEGAKIAYYSVDYRQFALADMLGKVLNGGDFQIERTYHLLKPTKVEDGTFQLKASDEPVTSVKTGDLIECKLRIESSRDRNYIMITDPIPSNCHPEADRPSDEYEWGNWYSDQTVYDNRITFFARRLAAGEREITYILRAESPGVVHALPATAANMYNPNDRTSDAETRLEVRR